MRAVIRVMTMFGLGLVAILLVLHFVRQALPAGCQRAYSHPPPNECQGEPLHHWGIPSAAEQRALTALDR